MFHKATSAPTNFKPRRSALNIPSRSLWHGQVRRGVQDSWQNLPFTFAFLSPPVTARFGETRCFRPDFLYFSDPPGTPLANDILVNDIDLIIQLQKRAYMYNPNVGISTMVDVIEVKSRSEQTFLSTNSLLQTFFFNLDFLRSLTLEMTPVAPTCLIEAMLW
jgi:hypothetical protein